jgi:zinc protease
VGAVAARYLAPAHGALVVYRPAGAAPLAADGAAMRASLDAERPEALEIPARTTLPSSVPGSRAWARDGVEASVHKFRTANGVPILVQRRAGAIAHLGWFARGGAPDESEAESGITTLMTRTALKGTQRRSAQRIAEDAEYLGSVLSGAASSDHLQWTVSVPARRLDEAAELLADVVQRPLFADDALESERAVALADIASVRDDMYRWPMRLATDAAWADHPYGRSVLGSEQSLPRITGTSLHEWHRRHALESPGAIVCVGDIDPEEAAALAARCFGALRVAADREIAVPAWTPTTLVRTDARDKAQSALALLFDGPKRGDDSRFAAAMIAGVASGLGGRFFDELRERQSLAYTVMASPIARRRAGAFAAYIAMSPEKEDAARVGLLREFARLCEAPVSDAELTAAQTYALGIHAIRRESGASVMGDIAESFLLGTSLRELDEVEACVRGVTAAGMLALAKRYFDPDRRVEGVVRGVGKSV